MSLEPPGSPRPPPGHCRPGHFPGQLPEHCLGWGAGSFLWVPAREGPLSALCSRLQPVPSPPALPCTSSPEGDGVHSGAMSALRPLLQGRGWAGGTPATPESDPTAVSIVGSYLDRAPCLACSCSRSLSVEASAGPVKGSLTQPQPQVGVPASQSGACASGRLQGGIGLSPPQPAARFSPRAALPQAPRSSVPEDAEGAVQSLGFSVWLCWLGRESGDMAESLALLGPGLLVLSPLAPGGPPWS